jgi:hypothetical protein
MSLAASVSSVSKTDFISETYEVKPKDNIANFEEGADRDFERILKRAERVREESRKEARVSEDEARESVKERMRAEEAIKAERKRLKEKAESGEYYSDASDSEEIADIVLPVPENTPLNISKNPFEFKADRAGGARLAFARVSSEIGLPYGFKSQVSRDLLMTGNLESGLNALSLERGKGALELLKGALEGKDANLSLFSLGKEALPALESVLTASGADYEKIEELMGSLYGEGGDLNLNKLLMTLSKAEGGFFNGDSGNQEGLVASVEVLNNLGQFLTSLGLSLEAVKNVITSVEPGSILPASDLRALIAASEGGNAILNSLISEGDLNFLSLALNSMADPTTINGINILLEGDNGQTTLSELLTFLSSREKPELVSSPVKTTEDIQTILSQIKSEGELVKAPVFNEIILKLSLLGDREIDKSFLDLSPALQALRGGLSYRGEGASAGGFSGGGGNSQGGSQNGSEKKDREERRFLMESQYNANRDNGAVNGSAMGTSLAGSLYEEVSGYSTGEFGKRLRDKLVYSAKNGIRKLKMSLTPESLGSVDIELKVKGKDLTANIKADSLEAYRALEKEVMTLKRALAEEGLELKLTLSYEGDGSFYGKDGDKVPLGNSASLALSNDTSESNEENFSEEASYESFNPEEKLHIAAVV